MSITKYSFKNPYIVIVTAMVIIFGGLYAFFFMPTDLFPDTTPPQVVVITVQRGASAQDISNNITQILERELKSLSGLRRITCTTKDEVSSIKLEFYYSKNLSEAATEVTNTISRVKAKLPKTASEPQVYTIDDTIKPLVTIALYQKKNSPKKLNDLRLLAENDIKTSILSIEGVADIDIFGGNNPEINILVDKNKLKAYNLSLQQIIGKLISENINIPGGYIQSKEKEYIVKTDNSYNTISKIKNTVISSKIGFIKIKDIAKVILTHREDRSFYRGNGHKAIAINVLRGNGYGTVKVIKKVKKKIKEIKKIYQDVNIEITTDQQPIIDVNIHGMNSSLISAIWMTVFIIFLFIADFRASLVIGVSIPLSFLLTFMALNFTPWTLNMVTLSGLIIAVGMVVDASIVVLENVYRLLRQEKVPLDVAVQKGADTISFAILGGMLTTIIVLIPIMFGGGYSQRILRPLSVTISITLIGSWLAAITIVPLILKKIMKSEHKPNFIEKNVGKIVNYLLKKLTNFYLSILKVALKNRKKILMIFLILTLVTIRVTIKNVGRALMPAMDTGILNVSFELPPTYNINKVQKIVKKMEKEIYKNKYVTNVSTVIGSEPGEISFNKGGQTTQQGSIQVTLVPRNKRKPTIWQIMDVWRKKFNSYPEFIQISMMEYGATPLSTTKAPIDVVISGNDDVILNRFSNKLITNLKNVKGLIGVRKGWYPIKKENNFKINELKCNYYGVSPKEIAYFIKQSVTGQYIGNFKLKNFIDFPILIKFDNDKYLKIPNNVLNLYYPTPKFGMVQLKSLVDMETIFDKTVDTREDLLKTTDVLGINHIRRVSQTTDDVEVQVEKLKKELPLGYSMKVTGSMENMMDTMKRVAKALIIGLVLLYFLLVVMFKSWKHPITIISIIPFSLLGAFAGLLIFGKPMCMPAMMGIILLNGTIVNNAILILTFILDAKKEGMSTHDAIINSVKLRLRPILMTTVSTVVGLTPLIFEWAVGLERMSPLGIVAASGLILGTFLTMIVTPVVFSLLEKKSPVVSG